MKITQINERISTANRSAIAFHNTFSTKYDNNEVKPFTEKLLSLVYLGLRKNKFNDVGDFTKTHG